MKQKQDQQSAHIWNVVKWGVFLTNACIPVEEVRLPFNPEGTHRAWTTWMSSKIAEAVKHNVLLCFIVHQRLVDFWILNNQNNHFIFLFKDQRWRTAVINMAFTKNLQIATEHCVPTSARTSPGNSLKSTQKRSVKSI